MKVIRQTATQLTLEDSSLTLAAVMVAAAVFLVYGGLSTGKKAALVCAGLFVVFAFLSLRKTSIVFDSARRMMSWQRQRYFRKTSGSIPYDDIKDIVVETATGGTSGRPTYRLAFVTPHGSWPMSEAYGGNCDRYASLAKQIQQFLKPGDSGVAQPATEGGVDLPASIRALLAQGRKIDAIALLRSGSDIDPATAKQRIDEIEQQMRAG